MESAKVSLIPVLPGHSGHGSGISQALQSLRAGVSQALGLDSGAKGIHGIAAAIRDKLANADPNAPDPVPDLLKTINSALDAAAKALADQGVDQGTIDAAVKRFRAGLAREIDGLAQAASQAAPAATTANKVDAVAARQVTKEKFSLDIVTAENDKVSIRFRSTDITEVAAAQVTSGDSTAIAAGAHVISRGSFKIEVHGNLDDSELKAIGDLLDKVDSIAKDFFGGDVQAAFSAASRVNFDSQELSSFNLRLTYSQSTAYARKYSETASLPAAPAPAVPAASTPAPAPAPAAAAAAAKLPALKPVAIAPPVASPVETSTPKVDDAPVDTSAAPAAPAASAKATIASFAKDVLAKLDAVSEAGSVRFSMRWKVDFLMTALSASAPASVKTDPQSDPISVLGDTLSPAVTNS